MAIPTAGKIPLIDLKNELKYASGVRLSAKDERRLEELKELRKMQKSENRSAASKKSWITRRGRAAGKSEEEISKEKDKIFTYNIGLVDNEMDMLLGKDFYVTINDRMSDPYKMKASSLMRDDSVLRIMKKYEKGVEKALEEVEEEFGMDSKKAVVLEKLLEKVRHNRRIIEKQFEEEVPEEELEEEYDEYPMSVDIAGDVLELNI